MAKFYLLLFLSFTVKGWNTDFSEVDELHEQIYSLLDADLEAALLLTDSSIRIAQLQDYELGEANGYFILGYIHLQKQELNNAFYSNLKAADILKELDGKESAKVYANVLLNSGAILRKHFKYLEALEVYDIGLEVARFWGLKAQEKNLLYNKASALHDTENFELAALTLNKAISIADENDGSLLDMCYNLMGLIYKNQGDYVNARKYYSILLDQPSLTKISRAEAIHNLAMIYKEENDSRNAKAYLDSALKIKVELEDPELLFSTLYELAVWNKEENDLLKAEEYAMQAKALLPSLPTNPKTFKVLHFLTQIHLEKSDTKKAKFYSERFYSETLVFSKVQEDLLANYKKYQADLIQAGFRLEQKAEMAQAEFNRNLGIIIFLIVAISATGYIREKKRRKYLASELKQMLGNV